MGNVDPGLLVSVSSELGAKSVASLALGEMFHQAADEGFRGLGCTETAQEPI